MIINFCLYLNNYNWGCYSADSRRGFPAQPFLNPRVQPWTVLHSVVVQEVYGSLSIPQNDSVLRDARNSEKQRYVS